MGINIHKTIINQFAIIGIILVVLSNITWAIEEPLDAQEKTEIIDSVSIRLINEYVYPDTAQKMVDYIRGNMENGDYNEFTTLNGFLERLNKDIQSVHQDQHLMVSTARGGGPPPSLDGEMTDEQWAFWRKFFGYENYGFHSVSRLEGNIGYLDVRFWPYAELGVNHAEAAMALLSEADALIIDVRRHLGGRFYIPQLILSYLFEEPIHILNNLDREKGLTKEEWTFGIVSGKRLSDIPIYVLTSWETVSGGELLPFVLQRQDRAVVIGEKTKGAAHRTHQIKIPVLGIELFIPHGTHVDPIIGTGWEGCGVEPDVAVEASKALATAHIMALDYLLENDKEAMPNATIERKWALPGLKSKITPFKYTNDDLKVFAGVYGDRVIILKKGALYYQREGKTEQRLIPMGQDLFKFESEQLYYVRVQFEQDTSEKSNKLIMSYDDGSEKTYNRNGGF